MAADKTRTAPISLRTFPELKAEVERLAQAEGRTLAAYVERLLQAHVSGMKGDQKQPQRQAG